MKATTRFLLGALSSVLFSTGFAKAGTLLDPITLKTTASMPPLSEACADDCVGMCSFAEWDV